MVVGINSTSNALNSMRQSRMLFRAFLGRIHTCWDLTKYTIIHTDIRILLFYKVPMLFLRYQEAVTGRCQE